MTRRARSVKRPIAFVAHSFARSDVGIISVLKRVIGQRGFSISTGEAPAALGVSEKVRVRINAANVFVAIFTRRHRLGETHWTTSPWVIEEKAYSFGAMPARPIVLIVEEGIPIPAETGGINGDLEYIVFSRYRLDLARTRLRDVLDTIL
jgi:hypothetical protein